MSQLETFRAAKAKIDDLVKERNEILKGAFAEASQSLFDAHPILKSISWNQYTPYFNDGDPCRFVAYIDYPDLEFTDGTSEEDAGVRESRQKKQWGEALTPVELATAAVHEFLGVFAGEDYESMFGDGCRITVQRQDDGRIECENQDYDHD